MKTGSINIHNPARVASAYLTKGIQRKLGFCLLAIVLGLLTLPSHAQTFTVLHNFKGGTDGANPQVDLVMDAKGSLYGTTVGGGTGCASSGGCGTVFKLAEKKSPSCTGSRDRRMAQIPREA